MSRRFRESEIVFTRHAESKFGILEQHGFSVSEAQVVDTLLKPDTVFPSVKGRHIAQRSISEHHVLRVVYREEGETLVVITFYPGRRKYYEGSV
jgi:hypothetical protein